MKVASFNVNSIRARVQPVKDLLEEEQPDVVCLQEIKCENDLFPYTVFDGFHCYVNGQKGYNGVAVCSRNEGHIVEILDEVESRTLGVLLDDLLIVSVYAPHGDVRGAARFFQKLRWYEEFAHRIDDLLKRYPNILLMGDFNVAVEDRDVWDEVLLKDTIGTYDEERKAFKNILDLGFTDAFRSLYPDKTQFTWWDYKEGRVWKDQGMRIDYALVSGQLVNRLKDIYVVTSLRKRRKPTPSDHAPLICVLEK
jgi:exodeoxyribonuclease-3